MASICDQGVAINNVQQVVAIQNKFTHELTWWNPVRRTKPQNFKSATPTAVVDPTGGGGEVCDFCNWEKFTAIDTFGRMEGKYAVSASNLFKYAAPNQSIIIFKHHDPLKFTLQQLCDLVHVAHEWFDGALDNLASNGNQKKSLYPLLVWNCLARAGASQFHGHAQVLLSGLPFPSVQRELQIVENCGIEYYKVLVEAHSSVGLARQLSVLESGTISVCQPYSETQRKDIPYATVHASLCPLKDAEIVVHGAAMTCPAFQTLFYAALRTLIDELDIKTFNAGIYNIDNNKDLPVVARVVGRGSLNSAASDFGGLEVFGGASIGHTDPWTVIQALDRVLENLQTTKND